MIISKYATRGLDTDKEGEGGGAGRYLARTHAGELYPVLHLKISLHHLDSFHQEEDVKQGNAQVGL